MFARLAALGSATLGEAWPGARILADPPRPLAPDMALAGRALPLSCRPGDNLALHRAIAAAEPGDVLVMDYGGDCGTGPFGEIMALACQLRGIAGLVTNGAVRDSRQIVGLGLPVFARGLAIRGTTKTDRGRLGAAVTLGGTEIRPGDIIVADADGIVVLPAAEAGAALAAAEARAEKEAGIIARLRAGETTLQIMGLEQQEHRT